MNIIKQKNKERHVMCWSFLDGVEEVTKGWIEVDRDLLNEAPGTSVAWKEGENVETRLFPRQYF